MFKTLTLLSIAATVILAACGGGGGAEDDAQFVASAQNDANNVAKANAASTFPAAAFTVTPDPTISLSCPKGSGFESVAVETSAGTTYAECVTYASMACFVVAAPRAQTCNPHLH